MASNTTTAITVEEDRDLHEACGVFGCVAAGPWPNSDFHVAADVIYPALVNLQHRGQESAGIVTSSGDDAYHFEKHRKMGLVAQIFTKDVLLNLKGNLGIGHTRYSTFGTSDETHCQPFLKEMIHGWFAVAHNGQLVNAEKLKKELLTQGIGLSTLSDTELIAQLLCLQPDKDKTCPDWVSRITHLMSRTPASYSLVIMYKDTLYAVRDPIGNRPLAVGKLLNTKHAADGDKCSVSGWVVASESCCFQSVGAVFDREVRPGEIVEITRTGVKSVHIVQPPSSQSPSAFCIFEYVYFARPDSLFEGQMVYAVRERCGRQLAKEAFVEADIVSTVPDSATPAAFGYAWQSGRPYEEVLYKNSYVGRTFIKPAQRNQSVDLKFGVVTSNVAGKRIVLIDDSIVRGTTMKPIVALLKRAGAKQVHIRVASPPLHYPCYMGINIPTRDELIANRLNLQQLASHIGADSVVYLSIDGLVKAVGEGRRHPDTTSDVDCCEDQLQGSDTQTDHVTHVVNGQLEAACCSKSGTEQNSGYCLACLDGKYPVHRDLDW
jgi:amidophosphoribosyltransferase